MAMKQADFSHLAAFEGHPEYCQRAHGREEHEYRSPFERDRDRAMYNRAFLRLMGKTQVFLSGTHDHIRNRLTHTFEVCQLARTLARRLALNETLAEAIALAHDLGHTPFGHVGERTLDEVMNGCADVTPYDLAIPPEHRGFKHNLQGMRLVCERLKRSRDYDGLNLTKPVLWGIANHTALSYPHDADRPGDERKCSNRAGTGHCFVHGRMCPSNGKTSVRFYEGVLQETHLQLGNLTSPAWSFEALSVLVADEIAQRHHDIEDGLLARIIERQEILTWIAEADAKYDVIRDRQPRFEELTIFRDDLCFPSLMTSFIVDLYVTRAIEAMHELLTRFCADHSVKDREAFAKVYPNVPIAALLEGLPFGAASGSSSMRSFDEALRGHLKTRILSSYPVQRMDGVGSFVIRNLFKAFMSNPRQLPDMAILNAMRMHGENTGQGLASIGKMRASILDWHQDETRRVALLRSICDYIANMTDEYAMREYQNLYGSLAISSLLV